jgi:hypothetical protein
VKELRRPIPESYWVLAGRFLAGEYPGSFDQEATRGRAEAFLEAGFAAFIDLTAPEDELLPYRPVFEAQAIARASDIDYRRFPIPDLGLPTDEQMTAILDAIDAALASGRKVYLHCWGGVGRTGTAVGCYLVRHGRTGTQALEQLAEWWQEVPKHTYFPRSPQADAQVEFIRRWRESSLPAGDNPV